MYQEFNTLLSQSNNIENIDNDNKTIKFIGIQNEFQILYNYENNYYFYHQNTNKDSFNDIFVFNGNVNKLYIRYDHDIKKYYFKKEIKPYFKNINQIKSYLEILYNNKIINHIDIYNNDNQNKKYKQKISENKKRIYLAIIILSSIIFISILIYLIMLKEN